MRVRAMGLEEWRTRRVREQWSRSLPAQAARAEAETRVNKSAE